MLILPLFKPKKLITKSWTRGRALIMSRMWISKAITREYLILSNHHASVFLNATEDQAISSRIEELVNIQLPVIHNVLV